MWGCNSEQDVLAYMCILHSIPGIKAKERSSGTLLFKPYRTPTTLKRDMEHTAEIVTFIPSIICGSYTAL